MNKLQYIKEFGINLFVTKTLRRLCLNSNSKFAWKINDFNENAIDSFLMKTIEKSKRENVNIKLTPKKTDVPEKPIWVMWYQGLENAPEIVKCCIASIKKYSSGHKVIVLSESNLCEYVDLPHYIIDKFENGSISRTHLSDMIRLYLLYNYGGAWLDSTILVTENIPEEYFNQELFSLNFGKKTKDPSHGRWTTFCFFAEKGNELIKQTLEYHYYYWMNENYPVDYVMFDYFINSIIRNSAAALEQILSIKRSNEGVFQLVNKLNEPYEEAFYSENTILYKLSWKRHYVAEVDGKTTIYGKLCEYYLK